MADGLRAKNALLLISLFLLSSQAALFEHATTTFLDNEQTVARSSADQTASLTLNPTMPNTNFKLVLPEGEPLTSASLEIEPYATAMHSGFVWEDSSIWSHSDATNGGVSIQGNTMTGTSAGTLWDFNNGNQGWTFSGYGARVTSPSCGLNGSTGGSLRTYAGSSYATSPTINLAGGSNIPFHAWVRQGSSGCGEEPDSNENLYLQYKTSSNTWTTFQTFQGSTSGGTVTNVVYTLPSAALHSTSQFRIYQNSGSGTCCDYWFVDDVHIVSPPQSNWTSPSLGWLSGSTQMLSRNTYAPLYLEANVPQGAYLNWTVIDASGSPIPGLRGTNTFVIPMSGINHETYSQFRLHLELTGSSSGMPTLYSISGDGTIEENFYTNPELRGWELNGSVYSSSTNVVSGGMSDELISPWYLSHTPLYGGQVSGISSNALIQYRTQPSDAWNNITLPHSFNVSDQMSGVQFRFSSSPGDPTGNWQINELHHSFYGGVQPTLPGLDLALDGRFEWGGGDERVGMWGWQNMFVNKNTAYTVSVTNSNPGSLSFWAPRDTMKSLSLSFVASTGHVEALIFSVQSQTVVTKNYGTGINNDLVQFNESEFEAITTALYGLSSSVEVLGTMYAEVDIEVVGTGIVTFAGLSAPHFAQTQVNVGPTSSFVMGVNEARYGSVPTGGNEEVTLPFVANSRGGLRVSVTNIQTSSSVKLVDGRMLEPVAIMTPSERWHTIETEYTVFGGTIQYLRLDVFGTLHHATILYQLDGNPLLEVGDTSAILLPANNKFTHDVNGTKAISSATFRIAPSWDDEMILSASLRLVMSNGVASIPYVQSWGSTTDQGYENDLLIRSVSFTTTDGPALPSQQYLKGGEPLEVSTQIGFEGVQTDDAFPAGFGEVQLWRGETMVANTTKLEGTYWNYTDTIPFTYADVVWTVKLVSMNGSHIGQPSEVSRTFTVDSVRPKVMETNLPHYGYRSPSPTQTIQVTIRDQPVLPTNVTPMVWREWLNDYNMNGWPDEDEYVPMTFNLPYNLSALTGLYTLQLDDTSGALGHKVAVYIEGTDPSGYQIQGAGGPAYDQHLMMYQLGVSAQPKVEPDAFNWYGGRKAWLHPQEIYTLNVNVNEPNGASDLAVVEVALAENQGSDAMTIAWSFETGNCTTTSPHLFIDDCEMKSHDGSTAGPYETDLVLSIDFHLSWSTPDLGETRREPSIRIEDRSGLDVLRTFPEKRWRFSSNMMIPEESVQLYLSAGSFLGDGARVVPNTPMEISGGLVFSETNSVPAFDCDVNILFAGRTILATAKDGIWSTELTAPPTSGEVPLTWSVNCIQGQGQDVTEKETSVKWILVDGIGPEPVEVLSPRAQAILTASEHNVLISVNEIGGLDVQSLQIRWEVADFESGEVLREGVEPVVLESEFPDGLLLELSSSFNLSEISREMLIDRLVVHLYLEGRDLAGNNVIGIGGKAAGQPIQSWNMEWLQPEFEINSAGIVYSRYLVDVGQTTAVTVEVANSGTLDGEVELYIFWVELDGTSALLQRVNVFVPEGGVASATLDWAPERPGLQWIEIELENGARASGPTIDARVPEELTLSEKVFGDANPILGSIAAILFIGILLTSLIWLIRLTGNRGSKEAYDWDEYSSEYEEEEDYDEERFEEMSNRKEVPELTAASTAVAAVESKTEETDWVKGSDGYWWYHDKETNEWWYKDADGNIVKHP